MGKKIRGVSLYLSADTLMELDLYRAKYGISRQDAVRMLLGLEVAGPKKSDEYAFLDEIPVGGVRFVPMSEDEISSGLRRKVKIAATYKSKRDKKKIVVEYERDGVYIKRDW